MSRNSFTTRNNWVFRQQTAEPVIVIEPRVWEPAIGETVLTYLGQGTVTEHRPELAGSKAHDHEYLVRFPFWLEWFDLNRQSNPNGRAIFTNTIPMSYADLDRVDQW